jgi:dTMP kinase
MVRYTEKEVKTKRNFLKIAIDGIDGAGKTTQLNILMKVLKSKGYKVGIWKLPAYGITTTSRMLKKLFRSKFYVYNILPAFPCLHLMLILLDASELNRKFKKYDYEIVLSDRSILANYAYLAPYYKRRDKLINKINAFLGPYIGSDDFVFLLDVKPETAISRLLRKEETLETTKELERLRRVREAYFEIIDKKYTKMFGIKEIRIVDGEKPIIEVSRYLLSALEDLLYSLCP